MTTTGFSVSAVPGIPEVRVGDDLADLIAGCIIASGQELHDGDVLCVASKIISVAEGRELRLDDVEPSADARRLHERMPRKDIRTLQVIIDQTGDPSGSRIEIDNGFIGGWLPDGLMLTSAGVDKREAGAVILLPADPDASAERIATGIGHRTRARVAVIITDSDGRVDKRGATQIAVGVHGISPLRQEGGSEETLCDMLAAAAGVVMGQRATGCPAAIVRGIDHSYDPAARITDALHPDRRL